MNANGFHVVTEPVARNSAVYDEKASVLRQQ